MKKLFLLIIITLMSEFTFSQGTSAIVEQQLQAYNARDIEAFMAVFHQDVELWTLGNDNPSYTGWDEVKEVYRKLFDQSPELHSTVINRSVIGNKVIDYERITGRKGSKEEIFLVMIYEVEEGKIRRAWAVRE